MTDLILNVVNLIIEVREFFEIENDLLRYNNLNFTEKEINKIRSLKEDEFNTYKINSTMSMENENDRNYLINFLDQQYEYGSTKEDIYNGCFYTISRLIILIMLVYIYISTFKFYQIEEIENEPVNEYVIDSFDKSRNLEDECTHDFCKIEKIEDESVNEYVIINNVEDKSRNLEDKSVNECVIINNVEDKSRNFEDEFTHEFCQIEKIEDERGNEYVPNNFNYKSRILEDEFTLEFCQVEKMMTYLRMKVQLTIIMIKVEY